MPEHPTWWVGDRNPSISDTITINGTPVDLTTPTVTFKMRAIGSATLKVSQPVTAKDASGNWQYDWQATDLDTADQYLVWVETLAGGKTQTVWESSITVRQHGLGAGFLCELADVRIAMGLRDENVSRDDEILGAIEDASKRIQKHCQREFLPTTGALRIVGVSCNEYHVDLSPYDLRSLTLVRLHPEATTPTTLTAGTDYTLWPVGAPEGVYTAVRLSRTLSVSSTFLTEFGYAQLELTGNWGFATVPADVRRACVDTVRSWLNVPDAQYAQFADEPRMIGNDPGGGFDLPPSVLQKLRPYVRMFDP